MPQGHRNQPERTPNGQSWKYLRNRCSCDSVWVIRNEQKHTEGSRKEFFLFNQHKEYEEFAADLCAEGTFI